MPTVPHVGSVPLDNAMLQQTITANEQGQGYNFQTTLWPLLHSVGYSSQSQVAQQLAVSGWSQSQIEKALSFHSGGLSQWFNSFKQGTFWLPFPAGGGVAGGAGAGAAGRGVLSGAASTAAKTALGAGLLSGLGGSDIEQFAVRVLEGLVGIALIFLGLQALTGLGDGTPAGAAATAAKYVR
jgi:hypothetical protein